MCKIVFVIVFFVILYPLNVNAARFDGTVKTEKLLQQLNETTDKLVEV